MRNEPITNFVIVGGGTAGWMAAAIMARFLDSRYTITLVESDAIGTVGVGEATIPMLRFVNQALGFAEDDFIRATQGTFKLGIEFDGWLRPGEKYIHAFGGMGRQVSLLPFYQYWLRYRAEGGTKSIWDFSPAARGAYAHKFAPIEAAAGSAPTNLSWAYHFDAGLYAGYLRRYAEANGVTRREGMIERVELDGESGHIAALQLQDGSTVSGDFFLDCSGFRGLLSGEALGVSYDDWSHYLPCDRAIAVPCERADPLLPYTRSTARKAGWQWRIPLQHRTGNGHVYCSQYLSDDEATAMLLANLDGKPTADPRPIRFTTGMRAAPWHKNCVAIGLASGFMEPLESTSIHLVQSAVDRFLKFLPAGAISDTDIAEYNRQTRFEWESIRDFLILHYHRNEREEDFWRACAAMDIPATLHDKIALFAESGRIFREHEELFTEVGWMQVMLGQGIMPAAYHPIAGGMTGQQLGELMQIADKAATLVVDKMIDHSEFIERHCRAENPMETA